MSYQSTALQIIIKDRSTDHVKLSNVPLHPPQTTSRTQRKDSKRSGASGLLCGDR